MEMSMDSGTIILDVLPFSSVGDGSKDISVC